MDLDYIAGMIDSDGCIYCSESHSRPVVRVMVAQMNPGILFGFKDFLSIGSVQVPAAGCPVWEVTGNEAKLLLEGVKDKLVLKANQASAALRYLAGESTADECSSLRHSGFVPRKSYDWLAGFLDGDGCVSACFGGPNKLTISLQTTIDKKDASFAEFLVETFGGFLRTSCDNLQWVVKSYDSTLTLLTKIHSSSYIKKDQVGLAIEYLHKYPKNVAADKEDSDFTKSELSRLKGLEECSHFIICNVDNYQRWTSTTALYPKDQEIPYLSLGLASEAGEVAGVIKKVIRDGNGVITDEVRAKVASELSDVLWYAARLADSVGLKLSDVMNYNLAKLESRKERGTLQGSGDNR